MNDDKIIDIYGNFSNESEKLKELKNHGDLVIEENNLVNDVKKQLSNNNNIVLNGDGSATSFLGSQNDYSVPLNQFTNTNKSVSKKVDLVSEAKNINNGTNNPIINSIINNTDGIRNDIVLNGNDTLSSMLSNQNANSSLTNYSKAVDLVTEGTDKIPKSVSNILNNASSGGINHIASEALQSKNSEINSLIKAEVDKANKALNIVKDNLTGLLESYKTYANNYSESKNDHSSDFIELSPKDHFKADLYDGSKTEQYEAYYNKKIEKYEKQRELNNSLSSYDRFTVKDHFIENDLINGTDKSNLKLNNKMNTTVPITNHEDILTHKPDEGYRGDYDKEFWNAANNIVEKEYWSTPIPENHTDEEKKEEFDKNVSLLGLGQVDDVVVRSKSKNTKENIAASPVSPVYSSLRGIPDKESGNEDYSLMKLRKSDIMCYNRTRIPVADNEFRKGFRYLLFTRPECYVMGTKEGSDNPVLCKQTETDISFLSTYMRMPNIIELLAPSYVTKTNDIYNHNWNYLLSNRAMTFSPKGINLDLNDTFTKTVESMSVTTGGITDIYKDGTFDCNFRDTKNFEIMEFLKMWMLYIHKRTIGQFLPPFNGYKYDNNFYGPGMVQKHGHPYDRAVEYFSSVFDIVTDESGSKILYWCKYYGVMPVSVSNPMNADNMESIKTSTVSATFHYVGKEEGVLTTFSEFNMNAGILDNLGRIQNNAYKLHDSPAFASLEFDESTGSLSLPRILGATGLFTGSPYITLEQVESSSIAGRNTMTIPFIKFLPLRNDYDSILNNGYSITSNETYKPYGYNV